MQVSVTMHPDDDGYLGRECPDCTGYFKTLSGTGYKGNHLPCHCPYCGHTEGHDHFWTHDQIEYAKSHVLRKVYHALQEDLKLVASKSKFLTFSPGNAPPVQYYREKQLETAVTCETCSLKYMIYGLFAYCPDCRTHNSLQILSKNLDLVERQVTFAEQNAGDFRDHLKADALENAISSFDGFGREVCRINAQKAAAPAKAEKISFQNLSGARTNFQQAFGKDFAANFDASEWEFVNRCAQKRHLLAHSMGVIDKTYVSKASDPAAIEGRKVRIESDEVRRLGHVLRKLGKALLDCF